MLVQIFGINNHIYIIMVNLMLVSINNLLSLDSSMSFDRDAIADLIQYMISPDFVSGRDELDKYINESDLWKRKVF